MLNHNIQLQIALLRYLLSPKPIAGAARREAFDDFSRKEIKIMKDALWHLDFIQDLPSLPTSGKIYCTTRAGKRHLKELERKELVL